MKPFRHPFNILICVAVLALCPMIDVFAKASSDSVIAGDSQKVGKPQSVGLVLSGGGAKGIAHIGVIRALEEHNIPIDYIAGTSMGSIVGGLYAAGYTTEEMMKLLLSEDFAYWSTGRIDPYREYYFSRQQRLPTMYTYDIPSRNDSVADASAVPASLINPLPMNFAFMELFAKYTAQCGGGCERGPRWALMWEAGGWTRK